MRFIVLDNGLSEDVGHHLHMAAHMLPDARRCGCEAVLLSHAAIGPASAQTLGARPTFSGYFYDAVGKAPFLAFGRIQRYITDLNNAAPQLSPGDVIFVPTASPLEVFALMYWHGHWDQGIKFAFLFHNTDHPAMGDPLRRYLWEAAADLLTNLGDDRVWIGGTNPSLVDFLGTTFDRPVRLVPSRTWYDGPSGARPTTASRPRVGFLGGLREAKGADRIPALIAAMRSRHPEWDIIVQCDPGNSFAASLTPFAADAGVRIVTDRLDDAAMARLIQSLDVLICPYRRESYRDCGSGLLNLANGWGVPAVVPSDTTLAEQLNGPAKPLGAVYSGDDDQAVVDAVASVIASNPGEPEARAKAAARWRRHASGTTMMRDLLDWAGTDTKPLWRV